MATGLETQSRATSLTSKGFRNSWLALIIFHKIILRFNFII
jgi:hypothetical protein